MTPQLGSLRVSCAQQEKLGKIAWVGEWFRFPLCVERLNSLVSSLYHVHDLFFAQQEKLGKIICESVTENSVE
jgi:hypothetical protein